MPVLIMARRPSTVRSFPLTTSTTRRNLASDQMGNDAVKAIRSALAATFAAALLPLAAVAQERPEDDQSEMSDIIVTGMHVRQGGAQDVKHFRSIATDVGMPRPEALAAEGLMGEHDLTLPGGDGCRRLFCLVSESIPAALPGRDDRLFVGLGFASGIDAKTWRRAPLDLIAVVDKSGSMGASPCRASARACGVSSGRCGKATGCPSYSIATPPRSISRPPTSSRTATRCCGRSTLSAARDRPIWSRACGSGTIPPSPGRRASGARRV